MALEHQLETEGYENHPGPGEYREGLEPFPTEDQDPANDPYEKDQGGWREGTQEIRKRCTHILYSTSDIRYFEQQFAVLPIYSRIWGYYR